MKNKCALSILVVASMNVLAAPQQDSGFVAHEWGTFTSVQGSDAVQLEWSPLVSSELPKFVYDCSRGYPSGRRGSDSKAAFLTLQRMETPVIYFYSEQARTVDVLVKFPQGEVTEWFPQIATLTKSKEDLQLAQQHGLRWSNVEILTGSKDPAELPPVDKSGSHYYAARNTEANLLRVANPSTGKPEYDKFLFYRGVGSFRAPLQVGLDGMETDVLLSNKGTEELRNLYILQIDKGVGKFLYVDRLAAGASATVKLAQNTKVLPLSDLQERISGKMANSLTEQGLYRAEAKAMVATWRDSWFGEDGIRVLYTLPRVWTERVLPLNIKPAPAETVRVMVGRAEVLQPSKEWQLLQQVVRYSESDSSSRRGVVDATRRIGLGRFTEAAIRHMTGKLPNRDFGEAAWRLLNATRPQSTEGKPFALK
jgi:hypothetical protein